ncbi:unnamed protein product [Rotaria magnacalcarata]|uniref:Uncharacterized protein n=1 Tax=Rotaria magnacalcarata TaxID=392030 RepID=A0A816ZG58_9BILA|nr:unnamed protein product [Rotaria magnacalcarata]CAF2210228.1 unnamed protein product [Rotaria magnacalcarata]
MRSQVIGVMLRKDSRSLTRAKTAFPEACAKFCAYDLRAFETVNGRVFKTLTQSERNKVVQSVKKLLKTVGIGESSTNVLRLPVTDDDETRKRRNRRAKRDDITVDDVLKEFASNNDSSSSSDNDSYDEVQLVAKL